MAKFKFVGRSGSFHLKDDPDRNPLKKGDEVDITVKRAEEANDKHGEIFQRVEDK